MVYGIQDAQDVPSRSKMCLELFSCNGASATELTKGRWVLAGGWVNGVYLAKSPLDWSVCSKCLSLAGDDSAPNLYTTLTRECSVELFGVSMCLLKSWPKSRD